MFSKKNLPLILGFSIPIIMILFVAVSIYLPGLFINPQYNFLYSTNDNYYNRTYTVNNGKLEQIPTLSPEYNDYTKPGLVVPNPNYPYSSPPRLYIYNVKTGESTPVTFEQAGGLHLDPSTESADGYKIEQGSYDGSFFFGGGGYNRAYYIVGHNLSKKLNLKSNDRDYDYSSGFLGWILP